MVNWSSWVSQHFMNILWVRPWAQFWGFGDELRVCGLVQEKDLPMVMTHQSCSGVLCVRQSRRRGGSSGLGRRGWGCERRLPRGIDAWAWRRGGIRENSLAGAGLCFPLAEIAHELVIGWGWGFRRPEWQLWKFGFFSCKRVVSGRESHGAFKQTSWNCWPASIANHD